MRTDRELLEVAAKAAKFGDAKHGTCWTESEYPRGSGKRGALWNYVGHMDTAELWNPLTDDGDALRLAVKLRINLEFLRTMGRDDAGVNCWPIGRGDCGTAEGGAHTPESVRRAIVRAAAAIAETHVLGAA